jgi:hypothetical protein
MITTKITYNEGDYCRTWNSYSLFCLRARYNKIFLIQLTSAFVMAGIFLALAHPEVSFYSPPLTLLAVVLVIALVVTAFDFFRYRLYQKKVVRFYKENEKNLGYELRFNEQHLFFNEKEKPWNSYRFYYIAEQDIYIFKNRRELALIWSASSMDKDAFVDLITCTKSNLKRLPAAKWILVK